MRPTRVVVLGVVVAGLVAACGGAAKTASQANPTVSPSLSASPSGHAGYTGPPRGLLAIGHSFLTGGGADPNLPGVDAPQYSWATGTSPAVDSIYERLVAAYPSDTGWVQNFAVDGSTSAALLQMAVNGLTALPRPRLVIFATIDNDIRCDGTDTSNHPAFAANIRSAIAYITARSPGTQILTMAQGPGRPATYAADIAGDPAAVAANEGPPPCSLFGPNGHLMPAQIRTLTAIIEGYEAVLKQVCDQFRQCHYSALTASFREYPDELTPPNYGHLNILGARSFAAFIWPTIQHILSSS
jgi:hypothetical protein